MILLVLSQFAFAIGIPFAALELAVAAIASEIAFGVELDEFVSVVARVRAGEADPGTCGLVLGRG